MEEKQISKIENNIQLASDDEIKNFRKKLQGYILKFLSREPKNLKTLNGVKYVPVSEVETLLDELYFGLWQVKNLEIKHIANEIVCSLELWVFHPTAQIWICRSGCSAVPMMQKKNSNILDMGAKIKNALVKNVPTAKAEALKNASKSLGKAFGRDLNRDFQDDYDPVVSMDSAKKETKDTDFKPKGKVVNNGK
jgi:hypothetical protein